ncbi:MAG: hypothetical protein KH452_12130 [Clostridiales bacterium]|nr:hypothetical protein [Clostridiales bacterium]
MFFGKPKMDEDERKRRSKEIDDLLAADKNKEAYAKTLELEKLDKDAAGLHLSYFYFMGECVREDKKEALKRIEKYVRRVPDDSEGWLMYGQYLRADGNEPDAASCFEKAAGMGNVQGNINLAGSCKILADLHRNEAAGTLNAKTYADNNNYAVTLYIRCMAIYDQMVQKYPKELDDSDWQGYGRAADMMYFLSLTGEVKKVNTADPESQNYLNMGLKIVSGKGDIREQRYWKVNAAKVYGQMEQAGYTVMAEYFRASMCLYACSEKKQQPQFVNAKWHMDRAQELYGSLNAAQKESYPEDFSDVQELYQKMEKKFGKIADNRLRSGEYPDLSEDYMPGQAPAMESCKRFMEYLNALQSGAPAPAPSKEPEKKKKGLFGFLR